MNSELSRDNTACEHWIDEQEKLGSCYEIELNDSLSSIESLGSWMTQPQNAFIGKAAPQSPSPSPSPSSSGTTKMDASHFPSLSPLHTPRKHRTGVFATEDASKLVVCGVPVSLGMSPGKPSRPPLLKKRSRRGILRSTRTSSRRSLLSSSHSTGSLTPGSRTPSSSGRRRNRSSRHRKKDSPFKMEKRVTFCLPDDSSASTSVSGSLLLCDVDNMETSLHKDPWGNVANDDFGNQSCRIVLPFINGLDDSDDEFAYDDYDINERLPNNMEDWFNSANDLGRNFNTLDYEGSLDGGCPTPLRSETSGCEENLNAIDACKTPLPSNMPPLPTLDIMHETPVISNVKTSSQHQKGKTGIALSTLTPIPQKEEHSEKKEVGTKESPTSVMGFEEALYASKEDTDKILISDDDDHSIELDQFTERLASVQLRTDDIAYLHLSVDL
ncbi:hypothetical protein IV203_029114 [Nitzschia inconspicua]|uniref:Uncharacterized protein n=1 Tax=Nitzschia inconspicua TaxID=303405 RepID=A0A9K3LR62_9STRA|nr:hypothetical protein IV203_029114 [Nitzschia inconspicua]